MSLHIDGIATNEGIFEKPEICTQENLFRYFKSLHLGYLEDIEIIFI